NAGTPSPPAGSDAPSAACPPAASPPARPAAKSARHTALDRASGLVPSPARRAAAGAPSSSQGADPGSFQVLRRTAWSPPRCPAHSLRCSGPPGPLPAPSSPGVDTDAKEPPLGSLSGTSCGPDASGFGGRERTASSQKDSLQAAAAAAAARLGAAASL